MYCCWRFDYKWVQHKPPSISPAPYAQALSLMSPKEWPGHVTESVCLSQMTPPGQACHHQQGIDVCVCMCVSSWSTLQHVSLHAALSWRHPWGVWMKTGEVPPSPRWVFSRNVIIMWYWRYFVVCKCLLFLEEELMPAGILSSSVEISVKYILLKSLFSVGGLKCLQAGFQTSVWSFFFSPSCVSWEQTSHLCSV